MPHPTPNQPQPQPQPDPFAAVGGYEAFRAALAGRAGQLARRYPHAALDDLMQEGCLAVLERLACRGSARPVDSRLRRSALRRAERAMRTSLGADRRQMPVLVPIDPRHEPLIPRRRDASTASPDAACLDEDWMHAALAGCSAEQQTAAILVTYGYTLRAAARVMDCSHERVRVLYRQALALARRRLRRDDHPPAEGTP